LNASALAFGRGEPPTPNAMTPKPIDENIRNVARIFFIVSGELKFPIFRTYLIIVNSYFA
jgi:hypothetical protein